MKFLILIALVCAHFPGFASQWPEPLSRGTYSMNAIQVLSKKHYITIHKSREKDKYHEFRKQGYACVHIQQNNFQCTKFLSTFNTEDEVREVVESEYLKKSLMVGELRGPIELLTDAEALAEWRVPQKVSFSSFEFEDYRLLETMSANKVYLGEPAEFTFILNQDNKPSLSVVMNRIERNNGYHSYLLLIHYDK